VNWPATCGDALVVATVGAVDCGVLVVAMVDGGGEGVLGEPLEPHAASATAAAATHSTDM
jgi:hypothetical protein